MQIQKRRNDQIKFLINVTLLTEFESPLNVRHNFSTPTQSRSAWSPQALIPVLIADQTMAPEPPFDFPTLTSASDCLLSFQNAKRICLRGTQMGGIITAAHQGRLFCATKRPDSIFQRKRKKHSSQQYSTGVSHRLRVCGTGHTGGTPIAANMDASGGKLLLQLLYTGLVSKREGKSSRNGDLCDVTKCGSNWCTHSVTFSWKVNTHRVDFNTQTVLLQP